MVFYRDGDGPERDITEKISASIAFRSDGGTSSARTDTAHSFITRDRCEAIASRAVMPAGTVSPAGSAEYLRVEIGGSGSRTNAPMVPTMLSAWTIGRVSLGVEARSFDEELGEDRQMAADDAFMGAWALRMQARDDVGREGHVFFHCTIGLGIVCAYLLVRWMECSLK